MAVLSKPAAGSPSVDIKCVAYSMGTWVHGSLQLTGAVCLGSAACTKGTVVAYELCSHSSGPRPRQDSPVDMGKTSVETVRLGDAGGDMDVDVRISAEEHVEEVMVFRTTRRLFEGKV
jgi:2-methylaconitate cis-trans-isomerase PrpF